MLMIFWRKRAEQRFLDNAHEAGQHDEVDLRFGQQAHDISFDFRFHPGSKPARLNIETGDPEIAGEA